MLVDPSFDTVERFGEVSNFDLKISLDLFQESPNLLQKAPLVEFASDGKTGGNTKILYAGA